MAQDEFDPQVMAEIRRSLEELVQLRANIESYLRAPVVPGSLESADRALPDARFVTIFAGQAIGNALDHLTAWQVLAHGPLIPMHAHFTLLRGAIEGSTRARWHVALNADSGTRVGRGLATRREDQVQRMGFEAALVRAPVPGSATGRTGAQRVAAFDEPGAVAARRAAGIGSAKWEGPTAVAKAFGLDAVYRLTSGLAHGWEYAKGGLKVMPEPGHPSFGPEVGHGRITTSEPLTKYVSDAAIASTRRAIEDFRRYRSVE